MNLELHAPLLSDAPSAGETFVASLPLTVHAPLLFGPDVQFVLEEAASGAVAWIGRLGEEVGIGWLPRGTYFVRWMTPSLALAAGRYRARAIAIGAHGERAESALEFDLTGGVEGGPLSGAWQVEAAEGSPGLDGLSWRQHDGDTFAQRFDGAPQRIAELLNGADALQGRVLEIGCGDGVLALGLALRGRPAKLVAVDHDEAWSTLPATLAAQHIPADAVPDALAFQRVDAAALPFADASFDLVVCWDRLEALDGGGADMLGEAYRALADDGLLCLRTCAESMPVTALEARLRALRFEPLRVRLRCHGVIDYSADNRALAIPDLAIGEIATCWRKRRET
jgi:SAM-dependent methyltransferase